MTEQVIDIRDRIEKMRNQMSPQEANIKNSNESSFRSGIPNQNIAKVEKKTLVEKIDSTQKKPEIIEEVSFVPNKKNETTDSKKEKIDTFEKVTETHKNERKENFKKSESFKTYDDYQNDNIVNEKKESVKIDENQPFPQFSLNVSNPISWKLMLLIMLMQLLTNMMLVVVLYLK